MGEGHHILVVDDDADLRAFLEDYLGEHGFRVTGVADGERMRHAVHGGGIDLVVLDLNLPGESGFDLARELGRTSTLPIVMLTGRGEEADRVAGLEVGADDYVAKPFSARELAARIGAVLRRSGGGGEADAGRRVAFFGDWRLDLDAGELFNREGEAVRLTTGEYKLLVAFVTRPNRVLSRDTLLDLTGGEDTEAFDRAIDIQVMRLRRKVEPVPSRPTLIETVRGMGYAFRGEVTWR